MNSVVLVVLTETEPRDVPSDSPLKIRVMTAVGRQREMMMSFIVVYPVQVESGSGLAVEL
jgi:hypothetical protein